MATSNMKMCWLPTPGETTYTIKGDTINDITTQRHYIILDDTTVLSEFSEINQPFGIVCDTSNNIYFTDQLNNRIRKINTLGIISTICGTGIAGYSGDSGPAILAQIDTPVGICIDTSNNIYFSDNNFRIRKINTLGIISTIAGGGSSGLGDGGLATDAQITNSFGIVCDTSNNIYFSDSGNQRIRKINTSGIISTICGTGTYGFSGDGGLATLAKISQPAGLYIDTSNNIYFSDSGNQRIRKINASGIISTICGTGIGGYNGDSILASTAQIYFPYGLYIDTSNNIYFSDYNNNRIRKINTSGIISTIAGIGTIGFSGDGASSVLSEIYYPYGLYKDTLNNIYIADSSNNRIRKINTSGIISTIAGNGIGGFSDGGLIVGNSYEYDIYFDGYTPHGTNLSSYTINSNELISNNTSYDISDTFYFFLTPIQDLLGDTSLNILDIVNDLGSSAAVISGYPFPILGTDTLSYNLNYLVSDWFSSNLLITIENTNIVNFKFLIIYITRNYSANPEVSTTIAIPPSTTINIPIILLHPPANNDFISIYITSNNIP